MGWVIKGGGISESSSKRYQGVQKAARSTYAWLAHVSSAQEQVEGDLPCSDEIVDVVSKHPHPANQE